MEAVLYLVLLLVTFSRSEENQSTIDYYVNLISNAYKNAETYKGPTNANEYYSETERKYFGRYDFIIIGAGASGAVAASRLSEINNWSVLLLEAGTYGDNLTDIPNMYTPVQFTHYNWGFKSTPQKTACLGAENHVCLYPRGKTVGGTTAINGLVYARGYKWDFDMWQKHARNKRWGYESVLQYFKKSEDYHHNDPDAPYDPKYHGKGGYFRVEYHKPRSPQLNAFLEANKELGFGVVDYNANKLGASMSQVNTVHGTRLDSYKAFLKPVKDRKNLKILTESYVTKIRTEKGVAKGVEFSRGGQNYYVEANKEVILSAGAIQTPQILMLSGIGPRKHLEKLGIEVVADLPVGSTLYDNSVFFGINVGTNYTEPVKPLKEYVKEYLDGEGPYAIPNNNQGVGFYESSRTKGTGNPEIELEFIPANATSSLTQKSFGLTDEVYEDLWENNNVPQSFIIYVVALHAVSSGTIRLKSKNPYYYPLIDSNFISDPENRDINTLLEGIQLVQKLLDTKAFRSMDAKFQGRHLRACKGHKFLSRDYWICALRLLTFNLFHPLGSCPMGTDPKKSVVNSELKVFGFKNLRIADASVFPLALAGHPYAPCVMVGEQLGDLVKRDHGRGHN